MTAFMPEINAVDDAEQPLTITRHLAPIIERSLRLPGGSEAPRCRADDQRP
ncbi:MAG: hypothetical protein ACRDTN_03735 [Mycobacterium sp.]